MLLALIIILILIWAAVIWSIYSNFVVFYSNFSESENYHKAYYASISALERWELVTKQRSPGYVWSGWFIMWVWKWGDPTINDWWSDKSLSNFSYLWSDDSVSSVFRTVNSRTTRIPSRWNGDVEWMLSAEDSSGYNMMGYENSEVFLLYYDNSLNNPYKSWGVIQSKPNSITWEIRLPGLLSWTFWLLDVDASLVWKGDELPKDDAIVDWQIRWKYRDGTDYYPFTIYSTQSTSRSNVHYTYDSIFREKDINKPLKFGFWKNWSPIVDSIEANHKNTNEYPVTIVGQMSDVISNYSPYEFETVFGRDTELSLRFSLLNLLRTVNSGHTYPFLEYYADFWTGVADKYYTINWEWNYKDFQINTIIQKPTVKDTVLWNFTSIF